MYFNRYRLTILTKLTLIIILILSGIIILYDYDYKFTSIFFFAIAIYFIVSLFKYIDRISRDLNRFLSSIKYSDFGQTYLLKNFGSMYSDLYKSIGETYNQLSANKIRSEENLQYLKTLIEQVPSGIISYKENGEVELINKAAKKILNVESLSNIRLIKDGKQNVKHLLENIEIGVEKRINFKNGIREKNISVFASNFKLGNQLYTLITLQDLANELEKERLENELNIAQNVQASLLPKKIPFYKNYEIYTLFKPAKRVGGDFYDFFEFGNNKLGIIISDVSGKGLGAAIYATLLKGIFQTLAYECSTTAELLKKANYLLYQMLDKKSFITAIYAVLDTVENTIVFSRAGHEPLLVFENEKREFRSYRQKGLGLGLETGKVLNDNLDEQIINLNQNDTVLFYTDGLVDLKNQSGVDDSIESFKDIIAANYEKGTAKVLEKLESEINNYTKYNEQFDDITIIMIKRKY